jgi:indolepyruvate ferredoxin oxidoreductase alpha subunit
MTGHQNNPANGLTIKGDPTVAANLEALAHAVGINRVRVVDPFNIEEVRKVVGEELEAEEPSLIISRRPCALLKNVKHELPMVVDREACTGCKACLQVGCPAIMQTKDGSKTKAFIDYNQCLGCGVCAASCKFDAIKKGGN